MGHRHLLIPADATLCLPGPGYIEWVIAISSFRPMPHRTMASKQAGHMPSMPGLALTDSSDSVFSYFFGSIKGSIGLSGTSDAGGVCGLSCGITIFMTSAITQADTIPDSPKIS